MSNDKTRTLEICFPIRLRDVPVWVKMEQANHLVWLSERAFRAYNRLDGTFGAWADYESASRELNNYKYTLGM